MKNLLLLFTTLLIFNKNNAQIVFCPPGAEWHYNFVPVGSHNTVVNETIKYVRDSVIGSETLKVLAHTRFYTRCNPASLSPFITLIKQKGDTVFFSNSITQQTWQVLYNFAAQAGQGWQTTYLMYGSLTNTVVTKTCSVSSVSSVTLNNTALKRINIGSDYITERFGWNNFLFMFSGDPSCHSDQYAWNLCYKDDSFGLQQFLSLPCDFSGAIPNGLEVYYKNNSIKIFPNPTSNILNLKLENQTGSENYEVRLVSVLGKEILSPQRIKNEDENFVLDLSAVEKGIYFVQVFEKGKLVATEKIVKE